MFKFLAECNPCDIHALQINLRIREVVDESVNVFQAQTIVESLIQSMARTLVFDYKFKKKDMAITIKTNSSVNIEDNMVEVELQVLF